MDHERLPVPPRNLQPLPYQAALRDYLKTEECELWNWFASHKVRSEQADAVRLDLLKSTYRVERESNSSLYDTAEEVAQALSLEIPVTLYQAQNATGLNAALAYLPDEAHVVFYGPVAERLTGDELRALLAHELGHLVLWQGWNGDFLIVDQILSALTHDSQSRDVHHATARLAALYTEVFCDYCALSAVEDPLLVISMLVKVQTGAGTVDAKSYLRQAEEIFQQGATTATELTHPEAFIRARAVQLLHEHAPDAMELIEQMIAGPPGLNGLDLLGQQKIAAYTRRLVDALLTPRWFQTDGVLSHARLFFDDYGPPSDDHRDERLAADLATEDAPLQDYYCYILLDFASADRDLEEAPLAAALSLTETLGLKNRFAEIAARELRLRKKQVERIDAEKERILSDALQAGNSLSGVS